MESDACAEAAVLPVATCNWLCDALSRAGSLGAAMGQLEAARLELLGPGLMTVNVDATLPQDPPDEIQLERLWSSDPAAFPVSGRKRKLPTPWTEQLLRRAEVFVGEGEGALAAVFDDHRHIASLGLRAVVNVPLLQGGRCAATLNVLSTRPQWAPHEVATVRLLALLATPWVMDARGARAR